MMEAIEFEMVKVGTGFEVREMVSRRRVAGFWNKAPANRFASYVNGEHAKGRVAQGQCSHGKACDRTRINWLPLSSENRAAVVLCPEHAAEVDAARW